MSAIADRSSAASRTFGPPPWAALATALCLRLAWGALAPETPLRGDEVTYIGAARSLIAGEGYSLNGQPVTHYMPGWPLVLALPLGLGLGLPGARVLQSLLSTAIVYESYLLATRLASRRAGVLAAWLAALFPPLVWYTGLFTSETISAALVGAWAAVGTAYVEEGGGWRRVSALVILGALVPLVRAELVVLAPLPFLARALGAYARRELVRAGIACLAVAAVLVPWVLYNQRRFGETIVLSTAGGVGLWIASHDPPLKEFDVPAFQDAVARLNIPGKPKQSDERYAAEAKARIRKAPLLYLGGRLLDLPRFFFGSHAETVPGAEAAWGAAWRQRDLWALSVKVVGFFSQGFLIVAAIAGAWLSFRVAGPLFLLLVAGAKLAAHAAFVQAPRFSLHIAPLLLAYAAVTIVWLMDRRPRGGRAPISPLGNPEDSSP